MGEIRFPDAFDIPEGAVCGWCMTPLTAENLATHDVTDEDAKPWEATPEDEPRVLVLHCIDCAKVPSNPSKSDLRACIGRLRATARIALGEREP